jgi:pimeloyl-ACP methyl ester carboxylesterase
MTDTPVALAYDISGSGPLLVAIHGITETRRFWDTVPLSEHFRVLRVDLRGHGESPRAANYELENVVNDVHVLLEQIVPGETPWIVGHSMGGVVASAYAALYPALGVVNIDQPLQVDGFQAALLASEGALRGDGFQPFMTALFASFYGEIDPATAESLSGARQIEQEVVLGNWKPLLELSSTDLDQWVAGLTRLPTQTRYLSFHGFDAGPDYAAWLRVRIPQAEVELSPVATHYPHLADPAGFTERLVRFTA